jgi:hypothetical protein
MKKIGLIGVLLISLTSANAKGRDTTFIKRPYYLGVSVGYTHWLNLNVNNQFEPPVNLWDLPATRELSFGFSPALQLSFPFLRRMECEATLQRTTWYGSHSVVSEYHYATTPGNEIVGFRTIRKWYDQSVWQTRAIFSYELMRKSQSAFLIGIGGRLDLQHRDKRNNYGVEMQLKCYLQSEHFGNLQVSVTGGGNGLDLYAGVRVGYMLKGTRTYRVNPDKYYVRTYEEGD